jgi:quinol monooxygenase YgiN
MSKIACIATLAAIAWNAPARAENVTLNSVPRPIVELRQYTLHPGQRDTLIELFEREFVETQEATGIALVGQFRDLDEPDRFVWMRAFQDMPSRADALQKFYTGPAWQEHRNAANATMIDSDNVLLLHVATPTSSFELPQQPRAAKDARGPGRGLVNAHIYYFEPGREREFVPFFEREVRPALKAAGIEVRASFVTETRPNTFPRLPVRDKDFVFVWFATFADDAQRAAHFERLQESPRWRALQQDLQRWFKQPAESLRLEPTARSLLRG